MQVLETLTAGANQPLDGMSVTIEIAAADLAGACLAVEEPQGLRMLTAADTTARVSLAQSSATISITLAAIGAQVVRLRLFAWSRGSTRTLVPISARISVDGTPRFEVVMADALLRAAEIVEIYRRTGTWKVRSVASGWTDHIPAMARAVGLPEAAFAAPAAAPATPSAPPIDTRRRAAKRAYQGPSPQVGPPPLRALLDGIIGPGPRTGDHLFLNFEVDGVALRLAHQDRDGLVQVAALAPLGTGRLTDATAELALRITGDAPLARITIGDDGAGVASAMAFTEAHNLDSGLLKALLAEVWSAAHRFAERAGTAGWPVPAGFTEQVPREFRLGVAEDLQDESVWAELHERLVANECLPLVDAPAALLAINAGGQLWIGPTTLAGAPRAWAIVVERILRADVTPRAGLWRALAERNHPLSPVRVGLIEEVGLHGPLAITTNYSAVQLPRTQVMEDLQHGLNFVDEAANDLEPMMRNLAPGASTQRNNLPWVPTRSWSGPGSALRDQMMAREIAAIPSGGGVPSGLVQRIRQQQASLGRPGVGYLGHLALLRAEERNAAAPAWKHVAREIVAMTPITGPGAPCAAASLHVRLARLDAPAPPRQTPRAARTPRPTPRAPSPPPVPSVPTPPAPDVAVPPRKRKWRLFG